VSNVAPYAETSTTDNVPYAEFPQARQKRAGEFGSGRESRVGFRIEARYVDARGRLPTVPNWASLF